MVKIGTEVRLKEVEDICRENASLFPKVRDWCEHLEVEGYMNGLVAQQLQLPLDVKLNCKHVSHPIEWMYLSIISKEFIENNCIGCQYHRARKEPNHGQLIIENYNLRIREAEINESNRRAIAEKIQQETANLVASGKEAASQTQLSILKLIASLSEESNRLEVATKLCAAAKLDPSFFSDNALSALFLYFDDDTAGGECIDAAYHVMSARGHYPKEVFEQAKRQITDSQHFDKLARMIALYLNDDNIMANHAVIDDLIERLWYKRSVGEPSTPIRNFQHSEQLLVKIGKQWPEQLLLILKKHLSINKKDKRININLLLHRLFDHLPNLITSLLTEIIATIEFVDDQYEQSADKITRHTIALIIYTDPAKHFKVIQSERKKLSKAGQAELLKLHIQLIKDRAFTDHNTEIAGELVQELISEIINKKVADLSDDDLVHDVSYVVRERTDLFQEKFEPLLGYVAKLANDESVFNHYAHEIDHKRRDEWTTFNYLTGTHPSERALLWQKIQNRYNDLNKIIGQLCKDYPVQNLPKVFSLLGKLDSKENEKYKLELLSIVMEYGREPSIMAGFIPQFYTLLLDPISMTIRYKAMDLLEVMFDKFPMLLTSSLWDIFEVFINDEDRGIKAKAIAAIGTIAEKYPDRISGHHIKIVEESLRNSYVIIHKKAVEVLYNLKPLLDETTKSRLFTLLLVLASAYKDEKEQGDTYSLIVNRVMHFSPEDNSIRYNVIKKLVAESAVGEDYYDSIKQINTLWRYGGQTNEIYELWLTCCIKFLQRFPNDRSSNSERPDLYARMYKLDRNLILERRSEFLALTKKDEDASEMIFDISQVLSLFGYFEDYSFIIQLTEVLKERYPPLETNKRLLKIVNYWSLIAKSETEDTLEARIKFNNDAANVF